MNAPVYLLALEGGGTRSQAVLLDENGRLLGEAVSTDVNTNFVAFEQAQAAVQVAVIRALKAAGVNGSDVQHFAVGLVGPRFGAETFGHICPQATYRYYGEREIIFARAGIYRPHGIALVAATGATAFGINRGDGRQLTAGGWGSLLGDEGSAYAIGLQGLRGAARAYEGRLDLPTGMVEAVCQHFGLERKNFRTDLVRLAYQKPLSRADIAGLAPVVSRLALEGDPLARRIISKAADDLAALALFAARKLFSAEEAFDVVIAGGLVKAGELILASLRNKLGEEFPKSSLKVGSEQPALALGRLSLHDIAQGKEEDGIRNRDSWEILGL